MTPERRRRINRLKKLIMYTVLFMILIPTAGCVFLGIKLYRVKLSEEEMVERIGFLERELQDSEDMTDRVRALLAINQEIQEASGTETEVQLPEEEIEVSANGAASEEEVRKVYLTFDDGPSIYTEELLDILAEHNVKATFDRKGKGAIRGYLSENRGRRPYVRYAFL